MILPQSYSLVLILMILSLFLWGSWANTFKLAGKYRFELYYVDFACGCLLLSIILAFTLGNIGFDGFSILDDLDHAGKRQWFYAFVAGVIFNLGNMLLTSAISVAGMAIAFSVGIGFAIISGSLLSLMIRPGGNILLTLAGCAMLAAAIMVSAVVYNFLGIIRHEALARAGKAKSTRRPTTVKGVILALAGGLLLGCFSPLVQKSMETEVGLGPYATTVVFSIGVLLATLVFSIFFMNLPVEGEPLEIKEYLRASARKHLIGAIGGAMWCAGMVASLAAATAPTTVQLAPALRSFLSLGFPLVAALWGLLVWKEFQDGDARAKLGALVMLVLFAGGLTLISLAPAYLRRG